MPEPVPTLRSSEASDARIDVLDGVRGVAIALVMLHHFTQEVPARTTLDHVLLDFTNSTWIGVDLFFVLSGLLITGILCDARRATNYFTAFYARRALRIFPAYYSLLALLYFVLPVLGHALAGKVQSQPAWLWLYGANWLTAFHGWPDRPVAHLWSLAIEEHFYLVWPLIVYCVPARGLAAVCVGIVLAAAAVRGWLLDAGFARTAPYVLTHARADSLALGALVAVLLRAPALRVRLAPGLGWAALVGSGATLAWLIGEWGLGWPGFSRAQMVWGLGAISACFAAFHAWLLLRAGAEHPLVRVLRSRPLRALGRYSYALYLFHLPLEAFVRWLGLHPSKLAPWWGAYWPITLLYIAGNAALSYAAAAFSWRLLEAPLLRFKDRFKYR